MDNSTPPGTPIPPQNNNQQNGGNQLIPPGGNTQQNPIPTPGGTPFPQNQPPGTYPGAQPIPPSNTGTFGNAPIPAKPPKPPIPPDPNARTGQLKTRGAHIFTIPQHPNTTFDEENFLTLLEGSISLTIEEKQRVIDAIPQLRIEQINELISIFEEEKQKFSELELEFADDVNRLKQEREKEIKVTETKREEASEEKESKEEAEALRRSLLN